jgi:hypothetical protein
LRSLAAADGQAASGSTNAITARHQQREREPPIGMASGAVAHSWGLVLIWAICAGQDGGGVVISLARERTSAAGHGKPGTGTYRWSGSVACRVALSTMPS